LKYQYKFLGIKQAYQAIKNETNVWMVNSPRTIVSINSDQKTFQFVPWKRHENILNLSNQIIGSTKAK